MGNVSVFADDTKLCRPVSSIQDVTSLQQDLDQLAIWAAKWQMRFNVDKCKVMHLGCNNMQALYTLNGTALGKSIMEKDLGVLVDNKLGCSKQCQAAGARANWVLSCIKWGIDSREGGGYSSPLQSAGKAPSRICCSVLVSSAQTGHY
uniref:Reverse transcriptase domain-containing protein n=1 Tax=Xenopus tropicalis TaxID=8364 RepID=A0A803K0K4_XENTR